MQSDSQMCLIIQQEHLISAGQEPGTNAEIKEFASSRGADFPLFSKIDVNGSNGETKPSAVPVAELYQAFHVLKCVRVMCSGPTVWVLEVKC